MKVERFSSSLSKLEGDGWLFTSCSSVEAMLAQLCGIAHGVDGEASLDEMEKIFEMFNRL